MRIYRASSKTGSVRWADLLVLTDSSDWSIPFSWFPVCSIFKRISALLRVLLTHKCEYWHWQLTTAGVYCGTQFPLRYPRSVSILAFVRMATLDWMSERVHKNKNILGPWLTAAVFLCVHLAANALIFYLNWGKKIRDYWFLCWNWIKANGTLGHQ